MTDYGAASSTDVKVVQYWNQGSNPQNVFDGSANQPYVNDITRASAGASGHDTYASNIDSIMVGFLASNSGKSDITTDVSVQYTGLQLETVGPGVVDPSPFQPPSISDETAFGRTLLDGKVVAHFADGEEKTTGAGTIFESNLLGPAPNTTPTGLPNPDPNGDIWIDTANNNAMYQYYANSVYGTGLPGDIADTEDSRRALYVKPPQAGVRNNVYVGWISTQDLGIAAANLAAYQAIEAAQWAQTYLNKVFTESVPPGVLGANPTSLRANDVWINTGDQNKFYVANNEGVTNRDDVEGSVSSGGWILRRDGGYMLFSLAGNDPFNLNPLFADWPNPDGNPNNWTTGVGTISQSGVAQSGDGNNKFSVGVTDGEDWIQNRIAFPTPLFKDSFISGVYVAKTTVAGTGNPGLVISLEHQAAGGSGAALGADAQVEHFQASIGSVAAEGEPNNENWQQIPFRAAANNISSIYNRAAGYANGIAREITAVTFSLGMLANTSTHVGGNGTNMSTGTGTALFDQIYFDINHPDMRMDRTGSIIGAYIADASIETAHIIDATITNAKIEDATIEYAKIKSVNADTITTGTLDVGQSIHVGGYLSRETGVGSAPATSKILIDGLTGRIIIRDSS